MADELPTTYNSNTDLNLGNIPQVDDPVLYKELLDIHDAIENLLKGSDFADAVFLAFIDKFRNVTTISPLDSPYTVKITDGTIKVDASSAPVTVILPVANLLGIEGYRYNIKCIDGTFDCILTTTATDTIDNDPEDIRLDLNDSLTVKSEPTNWCII